MKKRFIFLGLSFILVLGIAGYQVDGKEATRYKDDDQSVQEEASMLYDELVASFPMTIDSETGEEDVSYPENYGGTYLTDDGKLVIYQVDMKNKASYLSNENDNVVYKECKYSYNELIEIKNKIENYIEDNPNDRLSKSITKYGIYDDKNQVIVTMDNLSEDLIATFKNKIDSRDAISFAQEEAAEKLISVKAGQGIGVANVGDFSMGYWAKRNGKIGFVTAGHGALPNTTVKYNNYKGTNIAKTIVSYESGAVDAAFCEITNSNYSPSNTLNGTSNNLSTTTSNPGVGTTINKIGISSGHTSGKVLSTSVNKKFSDGTTVNNLTETSVKTMAGDSGGIFYSYISSSNTRLTLGIVVGGSSTKSYYSKASSINSKLGTSRY